MSQPTREELVDVALGLLRVLHAAKLKREWVRRNSPTHTRALSTEAEKAIRRANDVLQCESPEIAGEIHRYVYQLRSPLKPLNPVT